MQPTNGETNLKSNDDDGWVPEAYLVVSHSTANRSNIFSEALEGKPKRGHHPICLLCVWHSPRLNTGRQHQGQGGDVTWGNTESGRKKLSFLIVICTQSVIQTHCFKSSLSPVNGHPNANQVYRARDEEEKGSRPYNWVSNDDAQDPNKERLKWTKAACIKDPPPERSEKRIHDTIHHQQGTRCHSAQMELKR